MEKFATFESNYKDFPKANPELCFRCNMHQLQKSLFGISLKHSVWISVALSHQFCVILWYAFNFSSINNVLMVLTHYNLIFPFHTPWKHKKKPIFCIFREYKKGVSGSNGLKLQQQVGSPMVQLAKNQKRYPIVIESLKNNTSKDKKAELIGIWN